MARTVYVSQQALQHVAALLADYGGLPLSVPDICDELDFYDQRVRVALHKLQEQGKVHSWPDPEWSGRQLYAWKE
jgi:DNA-binding transcriptional regulator PaaX